MFSAQDLLGVKSPVSTPGSQEGGLKTGKQGAALFPGKGVDPDTFKESLAQAAGKGQSWPQTIKTELASETSKDVDNSDILQFLLAGLNPDHSNRVQKGPEKYSLQKLMQSINEDFLSADNLGPNQFSKTPAKDLGSGKEAAAMEHVLFRVLHLMQEANGPLKNNEVFFQLNKKEARGRNGFPAGREGADLQGRLMRLLKTFESAQSRIQEGNAAQADVFFQKLGLQSNAVSKTDQESRLKLGALLEKVQQLLESSPGVKPGTQEIAGETPGKTAKTRSEASLREQGFAGKQQSLPVRDLLETFESAISRIQEGDAAKVDVLFQKLGLQSNAVSKTGQESRPKLGALLEKVQQLLESSPGVKPLMQEIAGETPGKTAKTRLEASLPEQDFAWKQQSLPDRLQRVLDSVQARSNEMSRREEAGIDPRLRQFLNALAAESKNSLEAGPGKNDFGLTGLFDQQGNLKNVNLTENVFSLQSNGDPQVKPQSKQTVPDSIVQLQPGSGGSEKADNQSQPMRPSFTTAFDRNLQTMENKVVSQVFVRLFSGARQGSGNMTINMHPPELGKVKVRLISDKGGLNVHLHSQNQQVLGVLEKHLPTLQQSLEDQGVSLANLQVSVDSGNQDRPRFEDQDIWDAAGKKEQAGPAEEETGAGLSEQYRAGAGQKQGLSLRI
ncbi:MAG: flagellar hook-length control protein FliK [Desulfohalobiaceae bacterium]|nr:flagellar hook-length control protein FliK [Desulfohalobiaceae bacterium]